MPMYNLLEYSRNYSMTLVSLWNYYRDKIDNADDKASDGKSFKYETKIVGKTPQRQERPLQRPPNPDGSQPPQPSQPAVPTLNVEITITLKYLCNLWRFFHLSLINCETELDLLRKKERVLIEHHNNIPGTLFHLYLLYL